MGGYPLIGLSNGLYLAVLSLPFGEKLGMVQSSPIPKTSGTRRGHSRVAHHSEVCFVFGGTAVSALLLCER